MLHKNICSTQPNNNNNNNDDGMMMMKMRDAGYYGAEEKEVTLKKRVAQCTHLYPIHKTLLICIHS